MSNRKLGFTLIELIVTIAILAIIFSVSISSLNFYNSQLIKAELVNLEMNIHYLNKLANLENKKINLKFDLVNNKYSFDNKIHELNKNVKFGFIKKTKGPPSNPIKNISKAITFDKNEIIFEPNEKINSGIIYITDKNEKYMFALSLGIAKKQFVRKYQYSNKWNLLS